MGDKISEDAVLHISYQLFDKYVPRPAHSGKDLLTSEEQAKYAVTSADSFANFHKAFYSQLAEKLSEDK